MTTQEFKMPEIQISENVTFEGEWNRRTSLIYNEKFVGLCLTFVKEQGISAKEWNENMFAILFHFANCVCGLEDENKI
tara:strand:+ start:167 stop:400 length:234 start_codon:yes stop_codon:yes gene_type:complete